VSKKSERARERTEEERDRDWQGFNVKFGKRNSRFIFTLGEIEIGFSSSKGQPKKILRFGKKLLMS
jgi:hypothetical protein